MFLFCLMLFKALNKLLFGRIVAATTFPTGLRPVEEDAQSASDGLWANC
jgi:hypothetical protein